MNSADIWNIMVRFTSYHDSCLAQGDTKSAEYWIHAFPALHRQYLQALEAEQRGEPLYE